MSSVRSNRKDSVHQLYDEQQVQILVSVLL